jgi:hypothetical protein
MLLKIADNLFVNTTNITGIAIEKTRFPNSKEKPNPHWDEEKNVMVIDEGYSINFYCPTDSCFKSNIFNTHREAESKLKEWMETINANNKH